MQSTLALAVDPSSPDAQVENLFFQKGLEGAEALLRDELPLHEEPRVLRLVRRGGLALAGAGVLALVVLGVTSGARTGRAATSPSTAAAPAATRRAPVARARPARPARSARPALAAATADPVATAVRATPDADAAECRAAAGRRNQRAVLDSCARAFEARPSADTAVLLAEAELDRGQLGPALTWAQRALAVDPGAADAYVVLGSAEQGAGRTQAARTAYLKYLELAPTGRYARELRQILSRR